ncbi:hypothetical protein [Glaciimonas immobilis]|uniref:Uncharacterized protein n=1 Tax=Glaciimonas immobilis TaxID=728004 RepID=A0A840RLK8_9BURK|nr:hypothetical protein [Glaciimonas immobilis]KAF3999188.1 hypothetical protein HAV38_04425 [Glaciimonas immobilis]MBB5198643.1 hypothetical protein [Glaciimonas immobilis]
MFKFFSLFLTKMSSRLRRIGYVTKSGLSAKDLHTDAWIVASDIGEKRGSEVDFSDPDDQELVLSKLYSQTRRQTDSRLRSAICIDQDIEGEFKWSERLPASAASDPLISLLEQEVAHEVALSSAVILKSSYSEAAAYVIVLAHFNNEREDVCTYLAISDSTLYKRVASAANHVRVQPSLIDRIERVGVRFMPPPGWQYPVRVEGPVAAKQWGWEF